MTREKAEEKLLDLANHNNLEYFNLSFLFDDIYEEFEKEKLEIVNKYSTLADKYNDVADEFLDLKSKLNK